MSSQRSSQPKGGASSYRIPVEDKDFLSIERVVAPDPAPLTDMLRLLIAIVILASTFSCIAADNYESNDNAESGSVSGSSSPDVSGQAGQTLTGGGSVSGSASGNVSANCVVELKNVTDANNVTTLKNVTTCGSQTTSTAILYGTPNEMILGAIALVAAACIA